MKKLLVILSLLFLSLPAVAQKHDSGFRSGAIDADAIATDAVGSDEIATDAVDSAEIAANAVDVSELATGTESMIFCGQNAENGTIFFGPAVALYNATGADLSIGGTACDALDNATEATIDAPIFLPSAIKVFGMHCVTDGTLGAAETLVFTLRSAEADLTPSITCSLAEAETECADISSTTTNVAANATMAVSVVQSSDNLDDNSWCRIQWAPAADGSG